jgi:hypothetical protein
VSPSDVVVDILACYVWGFCRVDFDMLGECIASNAKVRFLYGPRYGSTVI